MSFNKTGYWKRRKQGLRGQGDVPKPQIVEISAVTNRKRRRAKLPDDPRYTKGPRPGDKPETDRRAIQERVRRQEVLRHSHAKPRTVGPPHPLSRSAR